MPLKVPVIARSPERGAILIQVAFVLLTFTMLSALVIDLGTILVSRHQVQNAADSAALAGASALAWDDYTDRGAGGPAVEAAIAVAAENRIWGEAPTASTTDVSFPACPDSDNSPTQTPIPACVQVDTYRDGAHGNALQNQIATLMGVSTAAVSATAIAETRDANSTDCLKPIAVPDRWAEQAPAAGAWQTSSTFVKWNPASPTQLLTPRDAYTAPGWDFSGTGLTLAADFGRLVTLSAGTTATPVSPISPWNYLAVRIPGSVNGVNIRADVTTCARAPVAIGDQLDLVPGNDPASIAGGLQDLINLDPGAAWNPATARVEGSCAQAHPRCASMSPRIIAVAAYDVNRLADASRFSPGATTIRIANIVGVFVVSVSGSTATGRIVRHPGLIHADAPLLSDAASFLRATLLVQ
jgi:Flp pilus assembly protein TadG